MAANSKKRDYKKEYRNYHGKPEQKANRAARNRARYKISKGKPKSLKGEVEHKDGNPRNNSKKNLTIRSKEFQRKQGGRYSKGVKKTKYK